MSLLSFFLVLALSTNTNAKGKKSECIDHGVSTEGIGGMTCFYESKTCTHFYLDNDDNGRYSKKDEIISTSCEVGEPSL